MIRLHGTMHCKDSMDDTTIWYYPLWLVLSIDTASVPIYKASKISQKSNPTNFDLIVSNNIYIYNIEWIHFRKYILWWTYLYWFNILNDHIFVYNLGQT
jgi:hypothetical protein